MMLPATVQVGTITGHNTSSSFATEFEGLTLTRLTDAAGNGGYSPNGSRIRRVLFR